MILKERIFEKERDVKALLEKLRNNLNSQSQQFDKNPNSWSYITSLTYTESKLAELIEYFETAPK